MYILMFMLTQDMERINLTISKACKEKIKEQSEKEHRSISGQIAWLIDAYAEICECYYCANKSTCDKIKKLRKNNNRLK